MKTVEKQLRNLSLSRGRSRSRSRSRGRRQRSRSRSNGPNIRPKLSAGEITVTMTEILYTVTNPADTVKFAGYVSMRPGGTNNNAGHLKALAQIYTRYRYRSIVIHYVACVGSTVGGLVAYGFTYDKPHRSTTAYDWGYISAFTPNRQNALYKNSKIRVPIRKMNPQNWLETDGTGEAHPGCVVVMSQGGDKAGTTGYFRIEYTVSFAGPNLQ